MRTRRCLSAVIILALAIGLAGCGSIVSKKWSATFAEDYDEIEYWGKLEGKPGTGEWLMDNNGLYMSEMVFFGPNGYSGDITMKVVFELAADAMNPGDVIDIGLSDGSGVPCPNVITASFENLGDPAVDSCAILDVGGGGISVLSTEYDLAPNEGFGNELILTKKGNNVKFEFNGVSIYEGSITRYASDLLVPSISILQGKVQNAIIKSVAVDYYGDALDMGYI